MLEGVNSFRRNGSNSDNYKYGNVINSRFDIGYRLNIRNSSIVFSVGYYNEIAFKDKSDMIHDDTGGEIHYSNVSLKGFINDRLQVFTDFQYALKNRLNGNVQLITPYRGNAGIIYLIPQKSSNVNVNL